MQQNKAVTIIGGGVAGAMSLMHLIELQKRKRNEPPLEIVWIDRQGYFGPGPTFSIDNPHLLLADASPADEMGLLARHPDDFWQWLNREPQAWRSFDREFQTIELTDPKMLLPRKLYGRYIEQRIEEALSQVEGKVTLTKIVGSVQDIIRTDDKEQIILDDDAHVIGEGNLPDEIMADTAVLALGRSLKKFPEFQHLYGEDGKALPGYITSAGGFCWHDSPQCQSLDSIRKEANVVFLGTGLAFTDAVSELVRSGFKGKITAFSLNGQCPFDAGSKQSYDLQHFSSDTLPSSLAEAKEIFEREAKQAKQEGKSWKHVVDALCTHARTQAAH